MQYVQQTAHWKCYAPFSQDAEHQSIQPQCPLSTQDGSKFIGLVSNPFTGEKHGVGGRCLPLKVITHERTEASHKNPFRDCVYCCIFQVASLAQNVRRLKWLQFLFRAEVATSTQTSHPTSQHWFTARSSLTCASAETTAFGEKRGFTLGINPISHLTSLSIRKETKGGKKQTKKSPASKQQHNKLCALFLQGHGLTLIYLQWWSLFTMCCPFGVRECVFLHSLKLFGKNPDKRFPDTKQS